MKLKKRRIALVGTASSREHAPLNDPDWEIWGLAARGDMIPRATRWLELHRLDGEPPEWAANWRKVIRKIAVDCEVLMLYPEPLGPNIVQFPAERITNRFGTYFLSSSFAWAMALAIDEMAPPGKVAKPGSAEIAIFGVDMEYGTEYRHQRMGFRHFIDVARVLGIEVTRLASSGLAYEPVPYPFIQDDPLLNKLTLRKAQTQAELDQLDTLIKGTRTLIAQNRAIEAEIGHMGNGYDPAARTEQLQLERTNLLKTSADLSKKLVTAEGQFEEQSWLEDYLQA